MISNIEYAKLKLSNFTIKLGILYHLFQKISDKVDMMGKPL